MPSLAELETELGLASGTLTGKADVVAKYDGYYAEADTKASAAQKALQDAQNLQRVIDENIANNGLNETNMAQLRASNAALSAALAEVKKAGFTGITIPDFPATGTVVSDPMKDLQSLIVNGFTNIGQTLNIANRYTRITGKPLPDDPATLADEARARRMDVATYAEQKYGLTALEQKASADRAQKEKDDYAAIKVKEYQETHPSVSGHPELNGGMPSNYPQMPQPRETKSVREFASMSAREKISNGMQRATQAVDSRNSAA